MRNLKKVLALVLAMAMSLSLAVTAGASYNTFPDQDKIVNDEAVFLLNALDIVEGRDTGDFDPTANINRAEAAKLVAALNLAGVPVPNAKGVSSFSDVLGDGSVAWANDFIEYGVAQGSINGMGDGTFAPKANVTGVQFAKMLLGILGYDAAEEGYTGTNWMYNVNIDAVDAGLYRGLDIDATAALSRDDAAQMMFNALQAFTVIYLTDTTGALSFTRTTLFQDKYPTVDGGVGIMTAISYNVDEAEYSYTVTGRQAPLVTDVDYTDMLGMNVLWFEDEVPAEGVLGLYAYENGAVVEGLVGDYDIEDKDIDEDVIAYTFDADCATVRGDEIHSVALVDGTFAANPYDSYKAIDNDNDGDFDVIIVYPVTAAQVTYVGEDSDDVLYFNVGKETYSASEYSIYAGIEKNDVARFDVDTTLKTLGTVTELVKQSGKVNSLSANQTDGLYEIVINGKAYDVAADIVDHMYWAGVNVFFYEINGYVVYMVEDFTTARDFLLITSITNKHNVDGTSINANVLFGDNTTGEITIAELDGKKGMAVYNEVVKYLDQAGTWQHGYLAHYEVVDGKYELTSTYALDKSPADLGFDDTFGNYDSRLVFRAADDNTKNATIAANGQDYKIADDAVVFVADISAVGDGGAVKYSVKSGADIKHLTGMNYVNYMAVEENDNGYAYVTFAFIVSDNASKSATATGILTSDVTYYIGEDDKYAYFTLWNGSEEITVNVKLHPTCPTGNLKAGTVIDFAVDAGKIVELVPTIGETGSVTAYAADSADEIYIDGTRYAIDKDAVVLYFNTEDDVAAEGSIYLNTDWENVYFVEEDGEIVLLVVDPDKYDDIQIEQINLKGAPEVDEEETPDSATLADVVAALEAATDSDLKGEGAGIPGLDANGEKTLEGLTKEMIIAFLNEWLADAGYGEFEVVDFAGTPIEGSNDHAVVVTITDGTNTDTAEWTYDFTDAD